MDGTFEVDPDNGILSIADNTALDYEENTQFILEVAVTDNHDREPLESSANIQINVTDENEFAPNIINQNFNLDENPTNGQDIGIIQATDEDTYQHLSFSIVGFNDNGYFQIDSQTGILSVKDSVGFDFELNQQMNIRVKVEDDHVESMADSATISVIIQNINEFADGMVAYYPFNGNAKDESENQIQGVVVGATLTSDRFGRDNSAYQFDGIDDYIRLTNNPSMHFGTQDFSISAWFSLTIDEPIDRGQAIVSTYHASGEREYILGASSNYDSIIMTMYNQGESSGYNRIYAEKTLGWHMVTITKSSSFIKMYMDGELIEETAVTADMIQANAEIMIGAIEWAMTSPDWFFNGKIDDVSFHNRELED